MIHVNLPDGATRALTQGTTAAGLASDISKSLAKRTVAAAVDGDLTDVSAPLQDGVQVDLIGRDDPRALEMIRHDLAHIMAEAVQIL
jgi:threonyl-tRNA synthetase